MKYRHPEQLGSDRLVDSVAAYYLYGGPVIVVDFGTATTFNAISENGEYLGGAIAPGIKTATDSLVNAAAKLPRIELVKAKMSSERPPSKICRRAFPTVLRG